MPGASEFGASANDFKGDPFMTMTLSIGPLIALIAGILILVMPRLLNYIVALYLILIGVLGLFTHHGSHIISRIQGVLERTPRSARVWLYCALFSRPLSHVVQKSRRLSPSCRLGCHRC
jgi:hypothetical protein